jgi:hypothetical protein
MTNLRRRVDISPQNIHQRIPAFLSYCASAQLTCGLVLLGELCH